MLLSICGGMGLGIDHNVEDENLFEIVRVFFLFFKNP